MTSFNELQRQKSLKRTLKQQIENFLFSSCNVTGNQPAHCFQHPRSLYTARQTTFVVVLLHSAGSLFLDFFHPDSRGSSVSVGTCSFWITKCLECLSGHTRKENNMIWILRRKISRRFLRFPFIVLICIYQDSKPKQIDTAQPRKSWFLV